MPQPDHISALPIAPVATLDADMQSYFAKCVEKLGLVPNVLASYAFRQEKLRGFIQVYNELMLGDSGLSRLEREMVAVVVSAANRCYYCLVAHGQAVRQLSGDPELGEMLVLNHRVARLEPRLRAMLDFAELLTLAPTEIGDDERQALRDVGLSDADIFDLCDTIGFFNMSNRVAMGIDMMPNREYHAMNRVPSDPISDPPRGRRKKPAA